MSSLRACALHVLAPLALGACAASTPPLRTLAPEQRAQALLALRESDLRVATIAYRLAAAGEPICPLKGALTGLTLHDKAQYAPELRAVAGAVLGLGDHVGLLAVAPGSAAERAGLRSGDALIAIAGQSLPDTIATSRGSYAGVGAAYGRLEQAASRGPVALTIERAGAVRTLTLVPVSGCASRVQLLPSPRIQAKADGTHLSVTTAILDYVRNDDELALVIAHEMAHNALGHHALLETEGVRRGLFGSYGAGATKVRDTERAADRLAYYLMARAGFDLNVAVPFWERLYQGPAGGRSAPTTHPSGPDRIEAARVDIAEIARKRASGRDLSP